jgi:hypothetical protein
MISSITVLIATSRRIALPSLIAEWPSLYASSHEAIAGSKADTTGDGSKGDGSKADTTGDGSNADTIGDGAGSKNVCIDNK